MGETVRVLGQHGCFVGGEIALEPTDPAVAFHPVVLACAPRETGEHGPIGDCPVARGQRSCAARFPGSRSRLPGGTSQACSFVAAKASRPAGGTYYRAPSSASRQKILSHPNGPSGCRGPAQRAYWSAWASPTVRFRLHRRVLRCPLPTAAGLMPTAAGPWSLSGCCRSAGNACC